MSANYTKVLRELSRHAPIKFDHSALHSELTTKGGVYLVSRVVRGKRELLYVGKAKSIRARLYSNLLNGQLRSHTLSRKLLALHSLKNKSQVKTLLQKECAAQWVVVPEAKERSFVEHFCIAYFRPLLND